MGRYASGAFQYVSCTQELELEGDEVFFFFSLYMAASASRNSRLQLWSGSVARVLLLQEAKLSMPGLGWAARNFAEALCSPKADLAREV